MADVAGDLKSWSTTAASNSPSGGTVVGTGLDDNLRELQKVVRQDLASKGADIASATTTDVGAVAGYMHDITGTTTITGLGTVSAGITKILKFEGVLTLTHNATSLILPGGTSILTADGDIGIFISEGSGNWRCVQYTPVGRDAPAGAIISYGGTAAPSGWLLCYGQAVSRTTYAGLFATISTTYGVGDGSNTFNVPDIRGRVIAGQDDMGGSSANRLTGVTGSVDGDVLGGTGGAETVTLTAAESGSVAHTHTASSVLRSSDGGGTGSSTYASNLLTTALTGGGAVNTAYTDNIVQTTTSANANAAAASAHNNVQPTIVLNYIIRT